MLRPELFLGEATRFLYDPFPIWNWGTAQLVFPGGPISERHLASPSHVLLSWSCLRSFRLVSAPPQLPSKLPHRTRFAIIGRMTEACRSISKRRAWEELTSVRAARLCGMVKRGVREDEMSIPYSSQ